MNGSPDTVDIWKMSRPESFENKKKILAANMDVSPDTAVISKIFRLEYLGIEKEILVET